MQVISKIKRIGTEYPFGNYQFIRTVGKINIRMPTLNIDNAQKIKVTRLNKWLNSNILI